MLLRLFSRNAHRPLKSTVLSSSMSFDTRVLPVKTESISFEEKGLLPVISDPESERNLNIAAHELTTTNNVVGFPTETVYGLGGSALSDESVKAIYRAKNRPADNPLIVHVSSVEQLQRKLLGPETKIPAVYKDLIEAFWPGPLTILLPVDENTPILKLVTAGQTTFGARIPLHPVARALIALSDTPLAAPSANASTRPSPTLASHVLHDLQGKIPFILDGGACGVGVELTVVDGLVSPPMLLRPGGVSVEKIRAVGGKAWENVVLAKKTAGKTEAVRTPGMKYRHYLPTAKVVLFQRCGDGKAAVSEFMSGLPAGAKVALLRATHFAPAADINQEIVYDRKMGHTGAQILLSLFRLLREADEQKVDFILVEGVEEEGDGLAVMNRLSKAASETVREKRGEKQ